MHRMVGRPVLRTVTVDRTVGTDGVGLAPGEGRDDKVDGVGVEVGLGGLRLFPELKYTFGLSSFAKEFQIGNSTFEPDNDGQLNTIMLSVGLGL